VRSEREAPDEEKSDSAQAGPFAADATEHDTEEWRSLER